MSKHSAFKYYTDAKKRPAYWVERIKNQFALSVERLLEHRGFKKKDLAERMDVSRPYITKVLRGDANLTMDTIGRMAFALDSEVVISLVPNESRVAPWHKVIDGNKRFSAQAKATNREAQIPQKPNSIEWVKLTEQRRAANE